MILIFHGDNQVQSRQLLDQALKKCSQSQTFRLDTKEINLEKINLILNSTSLFEDQKVLILNNYFSITKSVADSLVPLLLKSNQTIILLQDKKLTATQLKAFSKATVSESPLTKTLFTCLYSLKPGSLTRSLPLLHTTLKTEPYELFLYLLKGHLRKQLQTSSAFDQTRLKRSYLSLIELEFQTKTGALSIPKEIALERIIMSLLR